MGLPAEDPPNLRYRFAGVEIDPAGHSVRVDGRARDCSRKAFELLVLMCRNPGRVMRRDEVMDALWPGGQLVSDEALTQIVFRTRSVLGRHGALLRTVRGVGLKLDAEVVVDEGPATAPCAATASPGLSADVSASRVDETAGWVPAAPGGATMAEPSAAAEERTSGPTPARSPRGLPSQASRQALAVMILALCLVTLVWLLWPDPQPAPEDGMLDAGYGLRVEDLRAARADTVHLLREALDNEARGERERAAILLKTLHAADSTTPVPAIYLAIWSKGGGDRAAAREWLGRARARLGEAPDLFFALWLAFVDAEIDGGSQDAVNAAGALLDLRPQAWRMRQARAHLLEFAGMRRAALYEIQQIEVPQLGHRKRDMVIADRASMGDVDGAQAMLDRLDPASDPTMHAFLSGRLAWSRGDWDGAHAAFRKAAGAAFEIARLDLQTRALEYAGAIEVLRGDDAAALASFESARQALAGRNAVADADLSLFLAELHALAGNPEQARRELARALAAPQASAGETLPVTARFVAWRLFPDTPPERPALLTEAAAALWEAHEALRASEPARAGAALARARQLGVGSSRLADEARWLECRLALPVPPAESIDPPYPPLSRVILRREIRRELAARGLDAGPQAP